MTIATMNGSQTEHDADGHKEIYVRDVKACPFSKPLGWLVLRCAPISSNLSRRTVGCIDIDLPSKSEALG